MIKKWYIGTLMTAFAMLVAIQHKTVIPNQEIVLEFTNPDITPKEARNAVAIIKNELQSIGAKHTRISSKLKDGKLRIAYYIDADVESIKRILSTEQSVTFDHISFDEHKGEDPFPFEKESKTYTLDVCNIQKSLDLDSDLNGNGVLELKREQNGSFKTNSYGVVSYIDYGIDLKNETQKVNKSIAIAINNTSHNIPEVRAGPAS